MKAGGLPGSALSRLGPTGALVPASLSAWQPPQPLDVNSCLPSGAAPAPLAPPGAGVTAGRPCLPSQEVNCDSDSTTALARIVACPAPHSSAQTIGNEPVRLGVTR